MDLKSFPLTFALRVKKIAYHQANVDPPRRRVLAQKIPRMVHHMPSTREFFTKSGQTSFGGIWNVTSQIKISKSLFLKGEEF